MDIVPHSNWHGCMRAMIQMKSCPSLVGASGDGAYGSRFSSLEVLLWPVIQINDGDVLNVVPSLGALLFWRHDLGVLVCVAVVLIVVLNCSSRRYVHRRG